ncbi:MAG: 23S rRNA pseudouridine(1911/1915/1917) synthase RluD [Chromatiales bacterium]|nr:23S rRNA pseudouridine(1911/1915/1917) synthase RluD [Chromatiales bacterium]
MSQTETLNAVIPDELADARLDQALAQVFPQYSRSRLTQWIREGKVMVDGQAMKPKEAVAGGERVRVVADSMPAEETVAAEPIPLDIVYEDEALLVINKPAGLVTHPAAGNWAGTLQNALLHHAPELAGVPRAGIVHRLDKETSGLLVVARTLTAHKSLVEQLQARSVSRQYLALVHGPVVAGGTVEGNIGRHPVDRKRMAVVESGKPAVTHYRVEVRFAHHTLLRVSLETGRTHQIRVHMAHIQHPIVGDPVYGGRSRVPAGASETLQAALRGLRRQALHATRLELEHPVTGEPIAWEVPLPEDMQALVDLLAAETPA